MHQPRTSIVMTSTVLALASGLLACGRVDDEDRPSGSRPPSQISISAAITDRGVDLAPARVGGGPLRILISNQSDEKVTARLVATDASGDDGPSTKPIEPGGVAAITAVVERGTYRLASSAQGIRPGTLTVGKERESSDDELLLP
ncbi:MAG: hypothetical protein M0P31_18545 [Solirubrobacteraceae bacterium]|nr:hypothetical protein [Solirubrobacteraceae bacterium]